MAEYIERTEELMLAMNAGARAIEQTKKYHGSTYVMDCFSDNERSIPYLRAAAVLRESSETQAADVAPVRHGRWIKNSFLSDDITTAGKCCECGEIISWFSKAPNYCPNCGLKMDEGNDDDRSSHGGRSDGETVLGV